MGPDARFWAAVGVAAGVGLGVRLVYAFFVKAHDLWAGDSFYYHFQAKYLLLGKWFIDPVALRHTPRVELPSAQHPPLFTLFLAGLDVLGLHRMGAQKAALSVLGAATIVLVALVAREAAGRNAGAVAAWLAALYPGMWVFDGQVMSEALDVALATAVVLVAMRAWRALSSGRLVLLGFLLGFAALTRSELVLLFAFVGLPVVVHAARTWRARRPARRAWARAVASVFGTGVLVLVPWSIRNAVTFERPVPLSDQFGITVAAANNATTYGNGPLFASWCFDCVHDVKEPVADESVQEAFWLRRGLRYAASHLGRLPAVLAGRVGITWDLWDPMLQASENRIQGWPLQVSEAWLWWFYPLALLAVAGGVVLRRRGVPLFALLALPAVVTIAVIVTYGNLRFRAEAEVTVVVLAAVAIAAAAEALARPRPAEPDPTDCAIGMVEAEPASLGVPGRG
jgi:4-amino-4-deoxy-L-arabinose transferase-like glycosyltransferase